MLKGYPVIKSIVNPNVKRHAVITLKIFILLLYHCSYSLLKKSSKILFKIQSLLDAPRYSL